MLLIGTRNSTSQVVASGGLVNLGEVYRRYCKKNSCGIGAFNFGGSSISLQHSGIYKITVSATFTSPVAGDVTLQLFENGVAIPSALATETITTADTETRSVSFDIYVLVDKDCILGTNTISVETLSLVNTSVGAVNITNVVVDVLKVL